MKKRNKMLVFLLVSCMLLMTACGGTTGTPAASGSSPAQTEKANEPEASTSESAAPASGGAEVTITVTDWNTGAASEAQKKAVQQYMDENPGVIIDHQTIVYDEYNTKLNTLIAADDCPDIYYMNDLQAVNFGEDGFNAVATKTYGTLTPSWYYTLSALLYSNNARYFGPEGLTLGNPEGLEVLGAVADLANTHQVAPVPIAKEALPAVSQMFADKQLATYISGSYEYPDISAAVPDIGIAPLPMFKKPATIAWAACNQISTKTENMDETFKFFRWYVEADTNSCHLISIMPSEVKYYEEEKLYDIWMDPSFYNEEYRSVVPSLMSNHSQIAETALVKNASQVFNEVIGPDLDFLWLGEQTPQEVVETMKTDLVDVFEGVW